MNAQPTRSSGRGRPVRSATLPGDRWPTLQLFGDTLLVGIWVALACLPVVTVVPALAAGSRLLLRQISGGDASLAALWRDTWRAMRVLWPVALAVPGALALLALNLTLTVTGQLPGYQVIQVVMALLAAGVILVTLRLVGSFEPARQLLAQVQEAARHTVSDPVGSLLLLTAVGVCVVLVWMLTPLFAVVGGLLALAAAAVEWRREQRAEAV